MSPVPQIAAGFGRNSWGTKEAPTDSSTSGVFGVLHLRGSLKLESFAATELSGDFSQWSSSMADEHGLKVQFEDMEEEQDSGSDKERVGTSGRGGNEQARARNSHDAAGQDWGHSEESSSRALVWLLSQLEQCIPVGLVGKPRVWVVRCRCQLGPADVLALRRDWPASAPCSLV
jgi:hypothetical protein